MSGVYDGVYDLTLEQALELNKETNFLGAKVLEHAPEYSFELWNGGWEEAYPSFVKVQRAGHMPGKIAIYEQGVVERFITQHGLRNKREE